jgi:hypothetical protein
MIFDSVDKITPHYSTLRYWRPARVYGLSDTAEPNSGGQAPWLRFYNVITYWNALLVIYNFKAFDLK